MGNTILAHALFACNKINPDLKDFFSSTGNSHNISKLNNTDLETGHMAQPAEIQKRKGTEWCCVLEVLSKDWAALLRFKMSYTKWMCENPTPLNIKRFYPYVAPSIDLNQLWADFYNAYKDSTWPDCPTFNHLNTLPDHIQTEILSVYKQPDMTDTVDPVAGVKTELDMVEWLTSDYYETILGIGRRGRNFPAADELLLGDYLTGNVEKLYLITKKYFNWHWDSARSDYFYQQVLNVNQPYFLWLEKIKQAVSSVINNVLPDTLFEPWEQAMILAKICDEAKLSPNMIKWNNFSCNIDNNNVYLDNFIRTNYGKTF